MGPCNVWVGKQGSEYTAISFKGDFVGTLQHPTAICADMEFLWDLVTDPTLPERRHQMIAAALHHMICRTRWWERYCVRGCEPICPGNASPPNGCGIPSSQPSSELSAWCPPHQAMALIVHHIQDREGRGSLPLAPLPASLIPWMGDAARACPYRLRSTTIRRLWPADPDRAAACTCGHGCGMGRRARCCTGDHPAVDHPGSPERPMCCQHRDYYGHCRTRHRSSVSHHIAADRVGNQGEYERTAMADADHVRSCAS
jgi:hypothetical protein